MAASPRSTTGTLMPAVTWPSVTSPIHTMAIPATMNPRASTMARAFEVFFTGAADGASRPTTGRATARSGAATADPRVEVHVEQIDEEIDDDVHDGDHQHATLHQGVIVPAGRPDDDGSD